MRYCLLLYPTLLMHLTETDESRMTLCGREASFGDRYSRKDVKRLQGRRLCRSCERARDN